MWWRFMFCMAGTTTALSWLSDASSRPANFTEITDGQWLWLSIGFFVMWSVLSLWALFRGFE